ncbi:unnamed protein product, partial [Prorocentrum cordatum]
ARDHYLAPIEADFELLSVTLAAIDKHSLRQSRFLLQQQLGTLSAAKTVKSAQVASFEACKRLQEAKLDYGKKQKLAAEAPQASYLQMKKVAQLQIELDFAVSKAKAALVNDAAPKPAATPACDVGELISHAKKLEGVVGASVESQNLQLSEGIDVDLERNSLEIATGDFQGRCLRLKRKFVEEFQAHLKQKHEAAVEARKPRWGSRIQSWSIASLNMNS